MSRDAEREWYEQNIGYVPESMQEDSSGGVFSGLPDGGAWSASVSEDQILGILNQDPACDEPTARRLAAAARQGIENAVKRAEALIGAPIPVGDLACLDDLMSIDLDFSISLPSLRDVFASAIGNAIEGICNFAASKWEEATQKLDNSFSISVPGYTDEWGVFNIPGASVGVGSAVGSFGGAGSVDESIEFDFGSDDTPGTGDGGLGGMINEDLLDVPPPPACYSYGGMGGDVQQYARLNPSTLTWSCTTNSSAGFSWETIQGWKALFGR